MIKSFKGFVIWEGFMKKMLRSVSLLLVAAVLLSVFSMSSAGDIASEETINVTFGINIRVNGILFQPSDELGENVEPFLYNGTVYVPLRAISELFGANIQWLENPQYNRDMVYLDTSTA